MLYSSWDLVTQQGRESEQNYSHLGNTKHRKFITDEEQRINILIIEHGETGIAQQLPGSQQKWHAALNSNF